MKSLIHIIYIAVAIVLFGCQHHSDARLLLDKAEAMMEENPDSALAILRRYANSIKSASEQDRMYYGLLLTTAEDKFYITHTSDSMMLQVVEYYEDNGPQDKLADAYRIMGRVYDDMGNSPIALNYYQKAIDIYIEERNYKRLGLTYDHVGVIYQEQGLSEDCVTSYMNSYENAIKSKEKSLILYEMRNLGRAYTMLNDVDSALYYYNKAFEMGDNEFKKESVAGELASIYLQLENYENARRILSCDSTMYPLWAEYYEGTGQHDLAIECHKKSLSFGNMYAKEAACKALAQNERKKGNLDLAFDYIGKAEFYKDSIFEENKAVEVKRVEAKYNYQKIETERNQLAFDKHRQRYFIMILILIIVFLAASVIAIHDKMKRRKEYKIDQSKRAEYLSEAKPTKPSAPLEQLSLYQTIKSHSMEESYVLTENRWQELFAETDQRFPDFTLRLRTLYPRIKDTELVVCCLVKLEITNTQISTMLCKSIAAISNLRKRLYEKINGKSGSSRDFDEFIRKI